MSPGTKLSFARPRPSACRNRAADNAAVPVHTFQRQRRRDRAQWMAQFEKYLTIEEANSLIPELRELLTRIQEIRDRLVVDWENAKPVLREVRMNGGGKESGPFLTSLHQMNAQLRRLIELGVQLKDVERGLVDFPAWRGDREVLLCWHLGEARVAFWHDVDSGFAGQQAL